MEIIKREYKTYNFDELSQDAKEKAVEHFRDINVDYDDWAEFAIEDFKQDMKKLGYTVNKVYYSGFWSQGDGASFIGFVDVREWIKVKKLKTKYRKLLNADSYLQFKITQSGHCMHEMTMNIENIGDYDDLINGLENEVLEEAREKARKLYKQLEDAYYYLIDDKQVRETIEMNEYKFLEDGSLFN